MTKLRKQLRSARHEQSNICDGLVQHSKRAPDGAIAVDIVFARRLGAILKMWVRSARWLVRRCLQMHFQCGACVAICSMRVVRLDRNSIVGIGLCCRCVPSPFCAEAGLIYVQGVLLVLRSLITELMSRLEGYGGRWIIQQNPQHLTRVLATFVAVRGGVVARVACVLSKGLLSWCGHPDFAALPVGTGCRCLCPLLWSTAV